MKPSVTFVAKSLIAEPPVMLVRARATVELGPLAAAASLTVEGNGLKSRLEYQK